MRLTTDALIIRENNNIGESDRFVTALTRELGLVHASVRGARNLKNRSASATQLLCFSRLTLFQGREKYIIDEAEPLEVFFELRGDMEKLALSQYFCELAGVLCPREEPAGDALRLLLNALHFLAKGQRPPGLIKAVVELRLLSMAGYMPDLIACTGCGAGESEPMWLSPREATLRCAACAHPADAIALSAGVLAALRHIVYAPFEKCFSFSLPPERCAELADAAERFALCQLGRGFNTLTFYHTL